MRRVDGGWEARVDGGWNVGGKPNGGYLLAIVTRAMAATAGRPDPVSVTAHFLSPPVEGPVLVLTEVVKSGRSFVTVTAGLLQDGRERVRALGTFSDLAARSGPTRVSARAPAVPPPEECVSLAEMTRAAGRVLPEVMNRFDLRLPPESPWGRPGPGEGQPFEITGWIRFADGAPPDAVSAVAFADAFPPTLLGAVDVGWVPTIELTVHVRARPAPGWLLGSFRTRVLLEGLMEEDGELWDSSGSPVVLSRQLAMAVG